MSQLYNQIIELRKEINQHNYNYYVLDNPTISDTEFDFKLKKLENLEKEYKKENAEMDDYLEWREKLKMGNVSDEEFINILNTRF